MDKSCPICCGNVYPWDKPLKNIYNVHMLGSLCSKCGDKADSFIDYYGKKDEADLKLLFDFVSSGIEPQRQLQAMMSAGYWKIT